MTKLVVCLIFFRYSVKSLSLETYSKPSTFNARNSNWSKIWSIMVCNTHHKRYERATCWAGMPTWCARLLRAPRTASFRIFNLPVYSEEMASGQVGTHTTQPWDKNFRPREKIASYPNLTSYAKLERPSSTLRFPRWSSARCYAGFDWCNPIWPLSFYSVILKHFLVITFWNRIGLQWHRVFWRNSLFFFFLGLKRLLPLWRRLVTRGDIVCCYGLLQCILIKVVFWCLLLW